MAQLNKRGRHIWRAFQCHANAKYGQRQLAFFKLTQDAPHASARSVFVNAFHAEVPTGKAGRAEHLGQKLL